MLPSPSFVGQTMRQDSSSRQVPNGLDTIPPLRYIGRMADNRVALRLSDEVIRALDRWRIEQPLPIPTRQGVLLEAMREYLTKRGGWPGEVSTILDDGDSE